MYLVGIAPGLSGAVAVLADDGALVALHDTPVLTLRTSRGTTQEYDVPGLAALAFPSTRVRPAVRKKALGVGSDKEAARLRAMQLFPGADLRRKKDHGRAEALLLAYYGWQHMPPRRNRCDPEAR